MLFVSGLATGAPDEIPFASGMKAYEGHDFLAAIQSFEQAVQESPGVSRFHHWLGKAYGRQAQKSNWLRAIILARHAKRALERAVELDPNNTAALTDLLSYYEQAPQFLGGDETKARKIKQRLATLNSGSRSKVERENDERATRHTEAGRRGASEEDDKVIRMKWKRNKTGTGQ